MAPKKITPAAAAAAVPASTPAAPATAVKPAPAAAKLAVAAPATATAKLAVAAPAVTEPAADAPAAGAGTGASDAAPSAPASSTTDEASDKLASVIALLGSLQLKLKDFGTEVRDVVVATKAVQKDVLHLQKAAAKRGRRGASAATAASGDETSRRPSGFAKPSLLSDTLCEFMCIDKGSLVARTDVTRAITKYVKENNLFDEADKRTIKPDSKLKELLNVDGKDAKVTYFNLQSHIKHHFIKDAPATVPAVPDAPAVPTPVTA